MTTLATRPSPFSLTIVVPAYNESSNLASFVAALRPIVEAITTKYEILIINDGSQDNTDQIAQELALQEGKPYRNHFAKGHTSLGVLQKFW